MIAKKFKEHFEKSLNMNAMKIPSKQAIVEIASMSGDQDILYSYVATENDNTIES